MINRRMFLKSAAGVALAAGSARVIAAEGGSQPNTSPAVGKPESAKAPSLKKSLILGMFPPALSVEEKFAMARDIGMQGMEVGPPADAAEIKALNDASKKSGVEIHSIIFGGWNKPLSSPDTALAEDGAADVAKALRSASEMGAGAVLLVPAVVDQKTRYIEAYERSQKHLRKLAPQAEKLKVKLLVENVWNNFLLSPLEMARYVDEVGNPWVQSYFDVGNVLAFGWPEDWIRTLGKRIQRVHLKDFKTRERQFVNLRDGDVDWPAVRKALEEVGYQGYMTSELKKGDEAYLRDISDRMDKIINEPV